MIDSNPAGKAKHQQTPDVYHVSKLYFSGLELMIPQDDVVSVDSVFELVRSRENQKPIGHLIHQGSRMPVYCMSASLDILSFVPEAHTHCIVLRHSQGEFALLCQDIKNFDLSDIIFEKLPACMVHEDMPISHLSIYKDHNGRKNLGLVSNADLLAHVISMP